VTVLKAKIPTSKNIMKKNLVLRHVIWHFSSLCFSK